jgi:hypothetical protein
MPRVGIARCPIRVQHVEGTASAGCLSCPAEPGHKWNRCGCAPHWMEGDVSGLMLPYLRSRVSATVSVNPMEGNTTMN